jgi:hypothetical protein
MIIRHIIHTIIHTHPASLLCLGKRKRLFDLLTRPSLSPDILAIRLLLESVLLLAVPLLDQARLDIGSAVAVLCAHAEPEVGPVLAARPQLAVAVDVVEVAAQGAAVEGAVKGRAARHCGWEGGVEGVVVGGGRGGGGDGGWRWGG